MNSRRRRRQQVPDLTWAVYFGIFVGVIVLVRVVWEATHGLVLWVIPGYLGYRLWRHLQHRRAEAARQREHAVAAAAAAQQQALAESREAEYRRAIARELGSLLSLTPIEFERTVKDVLEHYGFRLRHQGRSGDRGVDLNGRDPYGRAVIIQCKRFGPGRLVGGPDVRALLGSLMQHRADAALLVTTSSFTSEAHAAAQGQPIGLIGAETLIEYATKPPPSTQPPLPQPR